MGGRADEEAEEVRVGAVLREGGRDGGDGDRAHDAGDCGEPARRAVQKEIWYLVGVFVPKRWCLVM